MNARTPGRVSYGREFSSLPAPGFAA
jgi:hypothetical protein